LAEELKHLLQLQEGADEKLHSSFFSLSAFLTKFSLEIMISSR